jgi:hypothetical protein
MCKVRLFKGKINEIQKRAAIPAVVLEVVSPYNLDFEMNLEASYYGRIKGKHFICTLFA